jgi:hypothetical protein
MITSDIAQEPLGLTHLRNAAVASIVKQERNNSRGRNLASRCMRVALVGNG